MSGIELVAGEHVTQEAVARSFQPPRRVEKGFGAAWMADGRLYLTNRRLIWQRRWYSLPLTPVRSFDIQLVEILDCELVGSALDMFFGGGGLDVITDSHKNRLLIANVQLWPPALWFSMEKAAEWRVAILDAAAATES